MTGLRKLLLNVHLWIGLTACLLLFVMGITGAILAFESEIDHALNPSLSYVTPQSQRLPLEQLLQNVKKAYPKGRVTLAELSASAPSPNLAYTFGVQQNKDHFQVFVDQYTGRILGSRNQLKSFTQTVHQLHMSLLGGPSVRLVTTWGSLLLCVMALSGVYLWWPRKIFRPQFDTNARRINFDLHNSVGFYASLFVFIFAFTAVVIHWDEQLLPVANFLTHSKPDEANPRLSSAPAPAGTHPITLDQAYDIASQEVPGARVTMISIPQKPKDAQRVAMKFPDDGTPAGRTWLFLDQFTGKVLSLHNAHTTPVGTRYIQEWNREIHTGAIFGLTSKIIACLASLAVAFLSITGPLIWFFKWRAQKAKNGGAGASQSREKLQQQTV